MPPYRPYEAIAALAGAGKTYLLTTRFIGLLSRGVAPERILAITFTRKAAAEIFDRVVRRLAAAAMNDHDLADLRAALRDFHNDPSYELPLDAPLSWLRRLLDAMPRVRIGTIDSFFFGITQAFALELGLPLQVELLDSVALDAARAGAVDRALTLAREDRGAQASFLEAFKRATAGESKRVLDTLRAIADRAHDLYLEIPDSDAWGGHSRIWSSPPWWMERGDLLANLGERLCEFEAQYVSRQQGAYSKAWEKLIAGVRAQAFEDIIDETLFARLVEERESLCAGRAAFKFSRKEYVLKGADAEGALAILAATAAAILRNLLTETQGRFRITERYETAYQETVRGQGRLAFSDIPFLLRRACDGGQRLDIDYRLDARFDHWMLDEFQDTSSTQWKVIGNLADEVLQSAESGRGFFYVGDVKQAIYAWRGGEATLFDQVRSKYAGRFGEPVVLDQSWRSSPVVLDAVNRVFGNLRLTNLIADSVCARWETYWKEHRAVPKHERLPGRVELHVVKERGNSEASDEFDSPVVERTVLLVESLVASRVKSIAVLVRLNSFGNTIADALKRRGLDARREINPALLDNGTVSAILSLFHLADHPADIFAWQHVNQTPLGAALRKLAGVDNTAEPDEARRRVAKFARDSSTRAGMTGTLTVILDSCKDDATLRDPFIAMRMRQFLETALDFDRRQGGGPSAFATYASSLMVSDPGAAAGITVMTVHKAKGLEFDAVILPDLQGQRRGFKDLIAGDLTVGGTETAPWVFPMPKQTVAPLDPVIQEIRTKATVQKVYDELCLLYVAMTRAKQGLYMVTAKAPADKALYAATILQQVFAASDGSDASDLSDRVSSGIESTPAYASGDPEWMVACRPEPTTEPPAGHAFKPTGGKHDTSKRRLIYQTPSGQEEQTSQRLAESLFRPDANRATKRGSALHDLFQRVGWIEEDNLEELVAAWTAAQSGLPGDIRDEILDSFHRSMTNPEIRAALARPSCGAELWREQAFELSLDGTWISGRFDRVVISRDNAGRISSATVLDFKSDRIRADEVPARTAFYREQVKSYRLALARLTGLPESAVGARLIFTYPCCVVAVY
jgi:ATP-dependent helicase/nuclease subunit A